MHKKIAVIIYCTDPEDKKRFLLRHNKPFNGYEDEWTIIFGNVDKGETFEQAAIREVKEEYDITEYEEVHELNYFNEYTSGKYGNVRTEYYSMKVKNLDIKIILNEESIGYDWVKLEEALHIMHYDDEKEALKLIP